MQFLNLSSLWILWPLVGIPLLIHWLSKRSPRKYMFSSLDDIRSVMAGRSRLFRWRHLIMLLLRTAALIALLFAFFRPLISSSDNPPGAKRAVLILVDHSLSMTHKESGTTALTRAHAEVKRLLNSLNADDQFNLIRVDHSPQTAFPEFSTDKKSAMKFLEKSPPALTHANFLAANYTVQRLTEEWEGDVDVYYFSDFQRRNWADISCDMLPQQARLFFTSATNDSQRPNQSLQSLSIGSGSVIAGGEVNIKARVANYSKDTWKGRLEAGFDASSQRDHELVLPAWSEKEVNFAVPVPSSGLIGLSASLPSDELAADNQRHLIVDAKGKEEVILLSGRPKEPGSPGPSLFLSTAVDPFLGEDGAYKIKHLDVSTLNPANVSSSTRLIASRIPRLNDAQAGTLITFLQNGGGVILFLDGEDDRENLLKLGEISGEPTAIQLKQKLETNHIPNGYMKVASGDFRSRFLELFAGTRRQNLANLEFYSLHHAAASGHGRILLSYADGTPAMAQSTIGLGTLLICNFSVAETESNLARQRLFPAWIHEMLLRIHSTGSAALESYQVGDSIVGEGWSREIMGRDLLGPNDEILKSKQDMSGERTRINFKAERTGVHRVTDGNHRNALAFAVNTDPDQSDLRTIDPSVLPTRANRSHDKASYVGTTSNYATLLHGKPAYHWFLIAALLFLLVEGLLFTSSKPNPGKA